MKVICQNCFEILAERGEDYIKDDPNKVDSIVQALDADHCLLTYCCPKCGCMLQVKV